MPGLGHKGTMPPLPIEKKDFLQVTNNEIYGCTMYMRESLPCMELPPNSYNACFNHFYTILDIKTNFKTFKLLVSIIKVHKMYY